MRAFVTQGEFEQIYAGLRDHLKKRTLYKFKIDKDRFIEDCASEINRYFMYMEPKNTYKVETGKAGFNESAMFVMKESAYGAKELETEADSVLEPRSDLEIADYIMYHTMLPSLAIFKILRAVEKERLRKLLSDLMDVVVDRFELDGAMEMFQRIGFSGDELQELGFVDEWSD